jgi:hypothetical protein
MAITFSKKALMIAFLVVGVPSHKKMHMQTKSVGLKREFDSKEFKHV